MGHNRWATSEESRRPSHFLTEGGMKFDAEGANRDRGLLIVLSAQLGDFPIPRGISWEPTREPRNSL